MNYENKIFELFKNDHLTTKEVVKNNIPRVYLTKLLREDKIERVSRGIYIKKDALMDDFAILQNKSKYAVFSNMTSLYLLGFSDRIPVKYDITVPSGYKGSLQKNNQVNLYYIKKEYVDLGVIEVETPFGNQVKIYDLERSICDIIQNKKIIDRELYNKSIRQYFYNKNKNTLKLYSYAKKMNIYNKVREVFEVLMWLEEKIA